MRPCPEPEVELTDRAGGGGQESTAMSHMTQTLRFMVFDPGTSNFHLWLGAPLEFPQPTHDTQTTSWSLSFLCSTVPELLMLCQAQLFTFPAVAVGLDRKQGQEIQPRRGRSTGPGCGLAEVPSGATRTVLANHTSFLSVVCPPRHSSSLSHMLPPE